MNGKKTGLTNFHRHVHCALCIELDVNKGDFLIWFLCTFEYETGFQMHRNYCMELLSHENVESATFFVICINMVLVFHETG